MPGRWLFPIFLFATPVALHADADDAAAVDRESEEYLFVDCVNDKDRSLLYALRDSGSLGAFEKAAKKAFNLCEMAPTESFSMKRLFDAIASFIGKPEHDNAGSTN